MASGKLQKLTIKPYKDPEYKQSAGPAFTVMFNPPEYSQTYSIQYTDESDVPIGANGEDKKFKNQGPSNLDFTIKLDGTGASGKEVNVLSEINKLKDVAYEYNGETHQPNYVKIFWGSFLFSGRLTKMDIKYLMFNTDGKPLRADINVSFAASADSEVLARKANKSSPDLTHVRTVRAGDTLPLMTYRIYGDASYYLDVARVNNITHFRNIKPGDQITFPPLN